MGPEKSVQITPAPRSVVRSVPRDIVSLDNGLINIPGYVAANLLQEGSSEVGDEVVVLPLVAVHLIESVFQH